MCRLPLFFLAFTTTFTCQTLFAQDAPKKRLPNILWITCEDIGPHLGVYGDKYATTPNLDRLAGLGLRYRVAWSNAPVCAPARTTIISGMYANSTGAEHMRSMTKLPSSMKMFVAYLRELGYYCTNHIKEDYNLEKTGKVWDESSKKAHWKNRKPGQPFFAVFNLLITHESQIRTKPHKLVHDPAKARIPLYHPDTPEVRHDWAQYYDKITVMDKQVGELLRELAEDGLAQETIVIFFSDHGSGMPRNKRFLYDCGLHVPFIVHFPEKMRDLAPTDYTPGGVSERLISFVDLAPTMLSLAGAKAPDFMQGEAFLGPQAKPPREYLYGFRGRMDERYDMIRSVRDRRYIYIRNYMPHKLQGQFLDYMFQTPTTRVWKKLFDEGELTAEQAFFWRPRPPEELYDLDNDRDEVHNLAASAKHQDILERLRGALRQHTLKIRDVGFLPEDEMHARSAGMTPYEMGHNPRLYPLERILNTAESASRPAPDDAGKLRQAFNDSDSGVRYWAALAARIRGPEAVGGFHAELRQALADKAPSVRIATAEALGKYGDAEDVATSLAALTNLISVKKNGLYVTVEALNALGEFGKKAAPALDAIRKAAEGNEEVPARNREYVLHLAAKLMEDLGTK